MSENSEITEIILAEERRAQKATEDNRLALWARELRYKFIYCGFLIPFYQWEGKDSSGLTGIAKFRQFMLPTEIIMKLTRNAGLIGVDLDLPKFSQ